MAASLASVEVVRVEPGVVDALAGVDATEVLGERTRGRVDVQEARAADAREPVQDSRWDDDGRYRAHDDYGMPIDDSDQKLVASYPFKGDGLEAFALQAVKKERFIRTIINTHFTFYFGRELRYQEDERVFYKRLWDSVQTNNFAIRSLIKTILTSPEYLEGRPLIRAHDRMTKQKRIDQKDTVEAGDSLSAAVNRQLSSKR